MGVAVGGPCMHLSLHGVAKLGVGTRDPHFQCFVCDFGMDQARIWVWGWYGAVGTGCPCPAGHPPLCPPREKPPWPHPGPVLWPGHPTARRR